MAMSVAILIIQKKEDPKKVNIFFKVSDEKVSTNELKYGAKYPAEKWAKPTDPKAMPNMIIKSVRLGFFFTLSVNAETFSFKSSIAVVSALSH